MSRGVGAVAFVGGLVFGIGLALSRMAEPEIVLAFLQLSDFGLLFVMGGAVLVVAPTFALARRFLDTAPITDRPYGLRRKPFDRNVLLGGCLFGIGWGLSGVCPGAAYASLGIGNYPIVLAIGGMFVGAYAQGYARSAITGATPGEVGAD